MPLLAAWGSGRVELWDVGSMWGTEYQGILRVPHICQGSVKAGVVVKNKWA